VCLCLKCLCMKSVCKSIKKDTPYLIAAGCVFMCFRCVSRSSFLFSLSPRLPDSCTHIHTHTHTHTYMHTCKQTQNNCSHTKSSELYASRSSATALVYARDGMTDRCSTCLNSSPNTHTGGLYHVTTHFLTHSV